jgi:hypothetical protein
MRCRFRFGHILCMASHCFGVASHIVVDARLYGAATCCRQLREVQSDFSVDVQGRDEADAAARYQRADNP